VTLIKTDGSVVLATAAEASQIIETLHRDEISKDLGKAGLETLAIVLYKHPISRREIDYIRGVNSAFIVRNLLIRGLIEKIDDTDNKRSFLYRPTIGTLSFMGLSSVCDLPDYEETLKQLNNCGDETASDIQSDKADALSQNTIKPDNESIEKPIDTSLSDIDNTYHVGKDEKTNK
jgi:segregation and condensation protein B